ncbi:unnamed protein product [Acanthoscelides obtectus]|uniref:Uncharacterized protein n=1 Tax=Acanthoscelides obtectus TaxID=200917 RepID=A0A9P0Q238_ACAOB|nr:unnamed protein product [Acanthoscelides obtectus]CAK1655775.1 hypothetical protein AOBTE_LOCUS19324 [Acanthoscelides obtectus]
MFFLLLQLDLPNLEAMMEDMPQAANVGVPDGRRYFVLPFEARMFFFSFLFKLQFMDTFLVITQLDSSDEEMESEDGGEEDEEPTHVMADSTSIWSSFPVSNPNDGPCDTTSVF